MRMNRIILASHGGLSAGMKDTVQMILGEMPNLYALATLRDETEPITVAARRLLEGFAAEDAVYIVTDVMGRQREQRDADPAAGVSGCAPDLRHERFSGADPCFQRRSPDTGRTGRVHCRCQGADY